MGLLLSRNSHVDHQHQEYVNLKHPMERKIQELEGELACFPTTHFGLLHCCPFIKKNNLTKNEVQPSDCDTLGGILYLSKQQIRELQMRHKSLEILLCRREWSHSACLREKDALIRMYKQMSLAAEQEWILEQNKVQAELDWQHLCENAESNWYQKSEDLTQSLSSARDQFEADIQKKDYNLHEIVLSALTVEREQIIQTSFNHSILPEGNRIFQYDDKISPSKNIPTLEIKRLQEQNASLRAAVAQMRKEMESLDKQMSSLPLTENGQLAEQGLLCTNKISTGTTLSNTKVSSVNLDCIVNPGTEKGPKAKVIEEKVVDLGQQFPDVGPGVSLRYGVSGTLQGMQNKLKEAARQISVLREEKQQLIEMGNGLRAELRTVLKEGLLHPVSSKRCTVCVVSGNLFPRELVKRIQCQLSALKHLQHRLTTQELQYAKQQHPSRISSLIVCSGLKDEEAPSRCGEKAELPSTEVQLDLSIENHEPKQQKADTFLKIVQSQPPRQSPSQAQQVQLSSSRAHNFCQGNLKLKSQCLEKRKLIVQLCQATELPLSPLDHAYPNTFAAGFMAAPLFLKQIKLLQPPTLSPFHNVGTGVELEFAHSEESQQNIKAKDKLEMPAADLTVRGAKLEVQQKLKSRNLSFAYPIKPKISSRVAKIRNYNIKD
ncbi:LOW QUALITY PROTEIN: coiled-coil domain-containing protein 57 [Guaruba guarouba]